MRLALIRTYQPLPVADAEDIAHPLGIMALDAWLRPRGFTDIELADMRLRKETPAQVMDRVMARRPRVVGLSALTIEKEAVHAVAAEARRRDPGVIVVVGGPYATSSSATILADPNVDYAVIGEGELTFEALLRALEDGADPAQVHGLALRRGGRVVHTPARPGIADLDDLPIPSWDRIDMAAYERVYRPERMTGLPWAAFYTSRGCPFKCTYCHDVFGKKFRARSPARVIEEMALLHDRYGVREFLFYDDIFNFKRDRVVEIGRLIEERGWKVYLQFPNGVRADLMTPEVLHAMRAAGTYRVAYAVESGSKRIQHVMKKRLNLDKASATMAETDRLGILMHGFFMLGFPGETRAEILETIEYALRSPLHTAAFFLVTPFEGSPLSEEYLAPAAELHGADFSFYDNPHQLSEVPPRELKNLQRQAYLRFYLDPRRMARLLRLMPRKQMMVRYAAMFARIVGGGLPWRGGDQRSFSPWRPPVGPDGRPLPLPDSRILRPAPAAAQPRSA